MQPGYSKRQSSANSALKSPCANRLLAKNQVMPRQKVLKSLCQAVQKHTDWDRVARYLAMFQFHPEELTEAGLSFEEVCALESRFPLLMDSQSLA